MKPTFRAKNGKDDVADEVLLKLVPPPDPDATRALAAKLSFDADKAKQIVVPK